MILGLLPLRAFMIAVGAALLGIGYWTVRNKNSRALRPFVVLVGALGVLAVAEGIAAGNYVALSIVWFVAYVGIPAVFAWFTVQYYGLPYLSSRTQRIAFGLPLVISVFGGAVRVLSPATPGAMAGAATGAAQSETLLAVAGFAQQFGIYYAGVLLLVSTGLVFRLVTRYEHLSGRIGLLLAFVALWPWSAYFVTPGLAGTAPSELLFGATAGGYAVSAVVGGVAVVRGGLFDAAPAAGTLGADTVLDELDDAVIVVDQQERVVRLNDKAAQAFDASPESAVGTTLSGVTGADVETCEESAVLELETTCGSDYFAPSVTPIEDRLDRSPGTAVVLRDVTAERIRAQQLSVLNRVLRHNLRNRMNCIMGQAEVIAQDGAEHADLAENILDSADDLLGLSDRTQDVQDILSNPTHVTTAVDIGGVVDGVVEQYRDRYPDATIVVNVESSLRVPTDTYLLEQVVDNLVENALEHNDQEVPIIRVTAERRSDPSTVALSVIDNGPGMPEQEVATLDAGVESPLQHGSGLGLWAANWAAARLRANLTFDEREPRGTVATVELPDTDRSSPGPDTHTLDQEALAVE